MPLISINAMLPPALPAGPVPLHHARNKARLRNRYRDKQNRHARYGGEIVMVGGDQHGLVERVHHTDNADEGCVLLQGNEGIQQRRDDLPDALRNDHEPQSLQVGQAERPGCGGLAPIQKSKLLPGGSAAPPGPPPI